MNALPMISFLGHFHPLILHLPIGILLLAGGLELTGAWRKTASFRPAIQVALFWGMISAGVSALLGYFLSLDGGYDAKLLQWHQWTGISVALFSVVLYVFFIKKESTQTAFWKWGYRILFGATLLDLLFAGHYGGALTHGENYLAEKAPGFLKPFLENNPARGNEKQKGIAVQDSSVVYTSLIEPVLKEKCAHCHNPNKTKGGLSLASREDILKGGKHGALLAVSDTGKSLLLTRIYLPDTDDKHMPPRSKTPLSSEEKTLIAWWVSNGAPFDKKVSELPQPEKVKAVFASMNQVKTGVFALSVAPASAAVVEKMRKAGFKVYPMEAASPWLIVQAGPRQLLSESSLNLLQSAAEQIVELDLSKSNLDDAMMPALKSLKHLVRLSLRETRISDQALEPLKELPYLEYLNLYQTGISDKGIASLSALKSLRTLYVWQTKVSGSMVERLKKQRPDLRIDAGTPDSDTTFAGVPLRAPIIAYEKSIFTDSTCVDLSIPFRGAAVRYTLDGSIPDEHAALFTGNVMIDQSAHLCAVAMKEGWKTSDPAVADFVKARYRIQKLTLDKLPLNPKYRAKGDSTLCDMERGAENDLSSKWIGYEGEHMGATLDLGRAVPVSRLTLSCIENTGAWVFFPKGIEVWTSRDGRQYQKAGEMHYPISGKTAPVRTAYLEVPLKPAQARYLKVKVLSNLKNPSWHPGAGKACWVFVDELLVE